MAGEVRTGQRLMREDIAGREMRIVFPLHLAESMLPLLKSEIAEFEAIFGTRVQFVERAPVDGPRWIVDEVSDAASNTLTWDAESLTLTSTVRDAAGLGATIQLLHSLVALNVDELDDARVDDLPDAIARLSTEVERGFPGFGIRGLDWSAIRAGFPTDDEMSLEDVQRMIARLQDGHTAVRENASVYNPPYAVELVDGNAVVRRVAEWSAAAAVGIEPGWTLEIDDVDSWLARTGSPPHSHALVAGRRAIALNGVSEREFIATSPEGERRSWIERAAAFSLDQLLQCNVVADDTLYVRMHNWIDGVGVVERFGEIIAEHQHRKTMVLNLRGNTGGNLLMAQRVRRLFLRERTLLGTVRFTRADGTLADPVDLWEDPAPEGVWPGYLVVLTDSLTYSASEDFLHGLQGLPHVTVVGSPSGGGSGRPRTLPLTPGWSVTMSTALTFDRSGHCIEGQGIPVDIEVDPFSEDWRSHIGIAAG